MHWHRQLSFSTCFLTAEEFGNGATSQLSDVLKLLDQISLEREDIRKVLHQSELCFLKETTTNHASVVCLDALYELVNIVKIKEATIY